MRAKEFLSELINRADDIEHFKNRIKVAAQLCERIGNHPLLFRAFKHRVSEVLLLKVDNSDTQFAGIKGGMGKRGQDAILSLLDIKYPVFTQMTPHTDIFQFHGRAGIFIPVDDVTPYWSPRIVDLGGQKLSDPSEEERLRMQNNTGAMVDEAEKWAATYVHAWPTEFINNELIFDCNTYYQLDLEQFFTKFAGKENKTLIAKKDGPFRKIDPKAFEKLKTYKDVAWYLNNTALSYIDWYQNELPKIRAADSKAEAERDAIRRQAEAEWEKNGQRFKPPRS